MKTYEALTLIFLPTMVAAISLVSTRVDASERPNILFIYTDDHSHRTVGCYESAYPFVRTPNIDQLAKNGVRFRYAYIGTWCMPSRATMLTGMHQHGVQTMRMEGEYPGSTYDPKQCRFWPSEFRDHGYQTAHIGKWHTGTNTGFGRDWDHQIVWNRPRHTSNAGNYYKDQLTEFNGGSAKMVKGYTTDNYTKWAVEYLNGKERDGDKPWFLWLCYGAVHGPFTPADRHLNDYPDISVPVPADIYPPRPGKPAYVRSRASWYQGEDGQPHRKSRIRATGESMSGEGIHGSTLNDWVRQYHQGVRALDESVGTLIKTLKETGQYDNTLIVFTSDQGIAFGQHGFRIKVAPYDANIRSPMIVSMPTQLPQGKVCDTPVGGPDIAPSFFDFAGIELPWEMHGQSIKPLLQNPSEKWSRPLMVTFTGNHFGSDTDQIPTDPDVLTKIGQVPWYATLHDGRMKYIRTFVAGEIEELYDLENDPEELTNLAIQKEYRATVESKRQSLIRELKRTGAKYADQLPPVGTF